MSTQHILKSQINDQMSGIFYQTITMKRFNLVLLLCIVLSVNIAGQTTWTDKVYNPDVPNIEHNPMKGWMPGYKGINSTFPYSIDHFYIPLNDVYKDWGECDWTDFENELDRIVGGGRHVVTRFWIDYPNRPSGMPGFLIDNVGYQVPMYDDNSPDWNDDTLMVAMEEFIQMFGERYDGDPRITFIEAGLYGFWGEWHTYPENSWAMSQANKDRLLIAYQNAFDTTHIGLRQSNHASTHDLKMSVGYYDDSFAYNTLCTGSWCSWNGNLVPDGITDNYKHHPFAGELRPEIQSTIFDAWPNGTSNGEEDLETCIRATHLSFMKAFYLFNNIPTTTEFENALRSHKMMGYEFFVSSVQLNADQLSNVTIDVKIRNSGIAPIYYDWEVEFAAINSNGNFLGVFGSADWDVNTIFPDSADYLKTFTAPIYGNDTYTILMRFVNPLEAYTGNARALRFANENQDSELDGWLTLGSVSIEAEEVETTSIVIENCPSDSIRAGEKYILNATVEPFNATNKTIYWNSSDPAVASIDSLGEIRGLSVGSTTITVYNHDSTLSDVCLVKVSDPAQWPFLDIVRSLPGRIEGEFFDEGGEGIAYHDDGAKNGNTQFRPDVWVDFNTHEGASNDYVIGWTADGEWLEYTVDVESGIYDITLLYYSGASPGSLKLLLDNEEITTITQMENQGNWGKPATIILQNIPISGGNNRILRLEIMGQGFDIDALEFKFHVDATGVNLTSCPGELAIGATQQLTANLEPADASEKSVTWSSSNVDVATVTSYGMLTGIAEGTATITVTTVDGGFTDQCNITVFKPVIPVTAVELSGCPEKGLAIDETVQLAASIAPANADDPSVTWSSSNAEILTVDQSGLVTAVEPGTAIISVNTTDGDFTETCEITVEVPVVNVTGVTLLNCPADKLLVDSLFQLTAELAPADADDTQVFWSSSDELVATVSDGGMVTAVSVGEATIGIMTNDGGFSDECTIIVDEKTSFDGYQSMEEIVEIFPNPVHDKLFLRFPESLLEKKVHVLNTLGQVLLTSSSHSSLLEMDVAGLSTQQLLIVKVSLGEEVGYFKVLTSAAGRIEY